MTTTLWDTNGAEIVKALAAERRSSGAIASGLALTLVAVADEKDVEKAQAAATVAAAAHPCRLLVVVRRRLEADERLDAEVQVGGRLGSNEAVVMRMYGRLTLHAESVVLPLLAPDAPVVTWWYGAAPEKLAFDALGVLAARRITDSAAADDPLKELRRRARDYAPGDTDLAWTRATPWRALLASAFDDAPETPTSADVHAAARNPSGALLAGWLGARLGVRTRVRTSDGPGVTAVEIRFASGESISIDRPDGRLATLCRTGRADRQLPLKRRDLGDLLAEELRRLDADQPFAEALERATGVDDLNGRPAGRTHIWREPAATRTPAKKASASTATARTTTATKSAAPTTKAATKTSAPTTKTATKTSAPTTKTATKTSAPTTKTAKKSTAREPAAAASSTTAPAKGAGSR